MCGAFQQEDNNKLDKEATQRINDAENTISCSIASPYSLVKFLKLSSIPFLKSLKSALPILGKSVNRLNFTSLKEMGH